MFRHLFNHKERTMNAIRTLVNRQPLKVTGSMRSPRGFFAALVLLFGIPIALLGQAVFGIDVEITLHFVFALTTGLIALAVFDFKLPSWITWLGSLSSGAVAAIFLLQGVNLADPQRCAVLSCLSSVRPTARISARRWADPLVCCAAAR